MIFGIRISAYVWLEYAQMDIRVRRVGAWVTHTRASCVVVYGKRGFMWSNRPDHAMPDDARAGTRAAGRDRRRCGIWDFKRRRRCATRVVVTRGVDGED